MSPLCNNVVDMSFSKKKNVVWHLHLLSVNIIIISASINSTLDLHSTSLQDIIIGLLYIDNIQWRCRLAICLFVYFSAADSSISLPTTFSCINLSFQVETQMLSTCKRLQWVHCYQQFSVLKYYEYFCGISVLIV